MTATAHTPVVLAAMLVAALVHASPARAAEGSVLHVAGARAYLDRGAKDGLALGALLMLQRPDQPPEQCRVERLADHHATCVGAAARKGDRFHYQPPPEPPPPRTPPPPAEAAELARRRAALERGALPKVEHKESPRAPVPPRGLRAGAGFSHTTYAAFDSGSGAFHEQRLDLALLDAPLGGGLVANARMTVFGWEQRPATVRHRPDAPVQFVVRQAEVATRTDAGYALSLGRVVPWQVPGVATLDGVQISRPVREGVVAGAFAGALPDLLALGVTGALTAGGYAAWEHRGTRDDAVRLLRQDARLALLGGPSRALRAVAQTRLQVHLARGLDASTDLLALADGERGAALAAARLDFGARPLPRLGLAGGYRYSGDEGAAEAALEPRPLRTASHRGDMLATWELARTMSVGVDVGGAFQTDASLGRFFAGPRAEWPSLAGGRLGASLGYREELGWLSGRMAWSQLAVRAWPGIDALMRLSWSEDRPVAGERANREAGLFMHGSAKLSGHWRARVSLLARRGFSPPPDDSSNTALVASAGVVGEF